MQLLQYVKQGFILRKYKYKLYITTIYKTIYKNIIICSLTAEFWFSYRNETIINKIWCLIHYQ